MLLAGDGKPPPGQQRPDLMHGPRDGGAVDPDQHRQGLVWSWNRSTTRVTSTRSQKASRGLGPAPLPQRGLVLGGPGVGQFGDKVTEVLPGDAGEARMGQGRTDPCWSSHPGMIVWPCSCPHDPLDQPLPITRQVVRALLETVPAPPGHRQSGCHPALLWRVQQDLADRPLHVRAEAGAEFGIIGKAGIVSRLHEAGDEASPKVVVSSLPGVDAEHRRVPAERLRVTRRTPKHLRPVVGQPLDVMGVTRVGEGMGEHGVLKAPLMVRGGERQEGRLPAGELEHRGSHHGSRA